MALTQLDVLSVHESIQASSRLEDSGAFASITSEPVPASDEPDEISLQDLQAKAALDLIREARDRFTSLSLTSVSLASSSTSRPANLPVLVTGRSERHYL